MTKLIVKIFLKNKNPDTPGGRESYGKLAGIVGIICNLFSIPNFIIKVKSFKEILREKRLSGGFAGKRLA